MTSGVGLDEGLILGYGADIFLPAMITFAIYEITKKVCKIAEGVFEGIQNQADKIASALSIVSTALIIKLCFPKLFLGHPYLHAVAILVNVFAQTFLIYRDRKAVFAPMTMEGAIEVEPPVEGPSRLYGRDDVMAKMERFMSRPKGLRNMILVAEPSSDTHLIVEECRRRTALEGSYFAGKKIYSISAATLLTSLSKGELAVFEELAKIDNSVCFIDQMEMLNIEQMPWLQGIISAYLKKGKLTIVGITSPGKYSQVQSMSFASQLNPIHVGPTLAEPCLLSLWHKYWLGDFTQDCPHVTVTKDALALATLLAYHHVIKGFVLDDAVTLLSDVISRVRDSSQQVEINGALLLEHWKEMYLEGPSKVYLGSLDPVSRQLFSRLGIGVEDLIGQVTELNKMKKDSSLSQLEIPRFLRDMNEEAREGKYPSCIGRDEQIRAVIRTLRQPKNKSLVLLGEPGIGKTAVFEELARRIVAEDPSVAGLTGKTMYWMDVNALMGSGTVKYIGELEKAVSSVIDFCRERKGEAILVIDELHLFRGAGAHTKSDTDLFEMFKNSLARDEIVVMGTANNYKWDPIVQGDPAIRRRIKEIHMLPPSPEDAIQMLQHANREGFYTKGYDPSLVEVTDEAVWAAVLFTETFMPDRFLPDKATVLISEAVSFYQEEEENWRMGEEGPKKQITPTEIAGYLYNSIKHHLDKSVSKEEFVKEALMWLYSDKTIPEEPPVRRPMGAMAG